MTYDLTQLETSRLRLLLARLTSRFLATGDSLAQWAARQVAAELETRPNA